MSMFLPFSKNVPPLVNDNEQGVSGGPSRKTDKIFWERKVDILLSCKQIFNFLFLFWNIYLTKLQFPRGKLSQKNAIFSPNSPPPSDAQFRFLLEVKKLSHWVVSSEVLTTHKVWGKVLFDHFQFCSILSDIRS